MNLYPGRVLGRCRVQPEPVARSLTHRPCMQYNRYKKRLTRKSHIKQERPSQPTVLEYEPHPEGNDPRPWFTTNDEIHECLNVPTVASEIKRLDFKKCQAPSSDDKTLLAQKKQHVQQQFKQRLGLIVDKPRTEITGLEKDLIDRCHNLLQCLSSGYKINNVAFKEYALHTARKLVAAYPWYNLPSSVHKVLIHGSEVIDHALLSIGELSEEAAEACNKLVKQFRRDNTRKMSRVVTNTDLIHRLLLNSDPYISDLRRLPRKKKSILSKVVLNLLTI
ncbi:hypothetical protein EVAR_48550_1 [Eumeta japonica]|uniref:Uncharacterized protein n=1 Tax=Eumeta variegata TaxID=151549 RepID=A0A4C1Y7Z3_EUMVA|nr:hypothetical protein EVAR_48550_1 [Eumeta japonica]